MTQIGVLLHTILTGLVLVARGKVRDVYDLGNMLLLVSTDRVSAHDVIMEQGIPDRGRILNGISTFWFTWIADHFPNVKTHFITAEWEKMVQLKPELTPFKDQIAGRSMLVKKATKVVPMEAIARGNIAGSGWDSYQATGIVCGITLPKGLQLAAKLEPAIFTPSTKAPAGQHDENISLKKAIELGMLTQEQADQISKITLEIFEAARDYAETFGIIIADTKFEFGLDENGEIILIDEALTPDSSRFWRKGDFSLGTMPPSLDKQALRDYLEKLCKQGHWNKQAPAPQLPEELLIAMRQRYIEAYESLVGKKYQQAA